MLRTDCINTYGDVYTNASKNHDYTPFCGENDDMIHDRIFEFMKNLEGLQDAERIAVFGHEGTVHQMINYVLKTRIDLKNLRIDNCTISVFSYENCRWRLEKHGLCASIEWVSIFTSNRNSSN